jgi:hypothetical protein
MIENLLLIAGGILVGGIAVVVVVNAASKCAIGGMFGW